MKSKKGAMEMSVGTIVTIVLLMTVLVLGIFLVQKIFFSATNAVESIDTEVQNEIKKLFTEEGKKIAVYPPSRDVKIRKGDDPKGFAFSIKNLDFEASKFTYNVRAGDVSKCGSLTLNQAEDLLIAGEGTFSLESGNQLDPPKLVKLIVPENMPVCTFTYILEVEKGNSPYASADIFITIK